MLVMSPYQKHIVDMHIAASYLEYVENVEKFLSDTVFKDSAHKLTSEVDDFFCERVNKVLNDNAIDFRQLLDVTTTCNNYPELFNEDSIFELYSDNFPWFMELGY